MGKIVGSQALGVIVAKINELYRICANIFARFGSLEEKIEESKTKMIKITYSELKALRDSSSLIPGMQYRIINYHCTTSQANTMSANNRFDIIVTADSVNRLNENARATRHESKDIERYGAYRLWCTDIDYHGDEIDYEQYYLYDGTVEVDGDTLYKYVKYETEKNKIHRTSYYILLETTDLDRFYISLDDPYDYYGSMKYGQYEDGSEYSGWSNDRIVAYENGPLPDDDDNILPNGEEYFASSNLESWVIKYCLDNDSSRFGWASDDGTGVIYYMKDEWGNECPFDFKNIKFWKSCERMSIEGYVYAFTYYTSQHTALDLSIIGNDGTLTADDLYMYGARNNVFKPTYYEHEVSPMMLGFNALIYREDYDDGHFYGTNNNFIDENSKNISLVYCNDVSVGNHCKDIIIGECTSVITIGDHSYNIDISNESWRIEIGCYTKDIKIGLSCYDIKIGDQCNNIELNDEVMQTYIGSSTQFVYLSLVFSNIIGRNCNHISIIDYSCYNEIQDGCNNIEIQEECKYNKIGCDSKDITIVKNSKLIDVQMDCNYAFISGELINVGCGSLDSFVTGSFIEIGKNCDLSEIDGSYLRLGDYCVANFISKAQCVDIGAKSSDNHIIFSNYVSIGDYSCGNSIEESNNVKIDCECNENMITESQSVRINGGVSNEIEHGQYVNIYDGDYNEVYYSNYINIRDGSNNCRVLTDCSRVDLEQSCTLLEISEFTRFLKVIGINDEVIDLSLCDGDDPKIAVYYEGNVVVSYIGALVNNS